MGVQNSRLGHAGTLFLPHRAQGWASVNRETGRGDGSPDIRGHGHPHLLLCLSVCVVPRAPWEGPWAVSSLWP